MEITKLIGRDINGYVVTDFIDSGGFGSVYKATKADKDYAIKIFREDYVLKEFRDFGTNNRIAREIEIMKSVNHPNLIKYVDDFKEEILGVPSYFLVMEFAVGVTLRKLINDNSLTEATSTLIFKSIVEGLSALHNIRGEEDDRGIIHRDLKPENIIVNANFEVKILDYGISKIIDYTSITATGNIMGSPKYMSPEQITDSKNIDKRSDLYTLGVIYFEMLTNKLPYFFDSLPELYDKIKSESPIPPRQFVPALNNKYENIILKLLEKEPYERFSNTISIQNAFEENGVVAAIKEYDHTHRFYLRLWNDKAVLEEYLLNNTEKINVEFPANFKEQQKNLLKLISTNQFNKIIDPATLRLPYAAQMDVKGLQILPYFPPKFQTITPDYLKDNNRKQLYVKQVIDEQAKLGADILISPYHFIHNSNVPATQRRNPVAEWFDLDIKLLKESIDYVATVPEYVGKNLFAGVCLLADSLLDDGYRRDLLNTFSALDCDGYFIYVDRIDNTTSPTVLFHYINTFLELKRVTNRPIIAGRVNALGIGLLAAGFTAYTSGAARFDSFYEGLYKEETEAFNMYERYYFPELLNIIGIERKNPVKHTAIANIIGNCNCRYCINKDVSQIMDSKNNKLHFIESIKIEVEIINNLKAENRIDYFLQRIDKSILNYARLKTVFKPESYQYLLNWKDVFTELKKIA
jgi:eukaryotic-like serine/threonine-protein kinase